MKHLISFLQTTQYGNRILYRRLLHHNRLEPSFQRRVLLDILSVFIQGGGTDTVQFSSGEHRLEHVARVQCSVRLPCPYDGMQLIDEQYDLAVAVLHILKDCLQPLFEFPSVFRSRDEGSHVQGKNFLILQPLGHVTLYYTLCKTLYHRSLSHAGLADEHRIILRLSGKYPYDVAYLVVSSYYGIELLIPRLFHQILTIFLQSIVSSFGIIGGNSLIAPYGRKHLQKTLSRNSVFPEKLFDLLIRILNHGKK